MNNRTSKTFENLNDWIDSIRKSKWKNGIDKKEIKSLFLRRLIKDFQKMDALTKKYNIKIDFFGVPGTKLFPITIDILNRELMPGQWKWIGFNEALCIVYYGICPELENFVSLILWPNEKKDTEYINSSKRAYLKIYELIKKDKDNQRVVSLSGNYRLNLPNEIRPYKSKITDKKKPDNIYYNWIYAPYLKEVGETILSHKSPLNFTRIFMREISNKISSKYTNFKTTVGKLVGINSYSAKFRLIYLTKRDFYPVYTLNLHHTANKKITKLKLKKGDFVALLIGEIVEEKPKATLMNIAPVEPIDIVTHIVLFRLYNTYLEQKRLYLMTLEELHDLFFNSVKIAKAFCKGFQSVIGLNPELFFKQYISPFVRLIDNKIFYIPSFLRSLSDYYIKLFDENLMKNKITFGENEIIYDDFGHIISPSVVYKYKLLRFLIELKNLMYKDTLSTPNNKKFNQMP